MQRTMQRLVRCGVLLVAVAFGASACDTVYDFEDVTVGGDGADRAPRERTNSQFLRAVYADLIGRQPEVYDVSVVLAGTEANRFSVDEQQFLLSALDSVGDPKPLRNLIVAGLVRHAEVELPDKADVDDPSVFITEQFVRFLGREPGAYELRAFLDEWNADPDVNPRTVVRALIASREYQSF